MQITDPFRGIHIIFLIIKKTCHMSPVGLGNMKISINVAQKLSKHYAKCCI
jgi:hypothetical protein